MFYDHSWGVGYSTFPFRDLEGTTFLLAFLSIHILLGDCIRWADLSPVERFLDKFYDDITTHYGELKCCLIYTFWNAVAVYFVLGLMLTLCELVFGNAFSGSTTATIKCLLLSHVVTCGKEWGPLWAYSMFQFESMNCQITKLFHGSSMQVSISYYDPVSS